MHGAFEKLARARIDPLQVLEHDQERSAVGHVPDVLDQRVDQLPAQLAPVDRGRRESAVVPDVEQRDEQREQTFDGHRRAFQRAAQLLRSRRRALAVGELGPGAHGGGDGIEGGVAVDRRALQEQARRQLAPHDPLVQRPGEPGFSDPALAGEHDHPTASGACLVPQSEQSRELAFAIDQRQARRARRLEAIHGRDAHGLPDAYRVIDALEGLLAAIDQREQVAEQLPGQRPDDDAVHGRDALDAGGKVGRLAQRLGQVPAHAVRRGAAIGDDGARSYADAHGESHGRPARRARQARDGVDDVERGQHRALGGFLQRARVAEVGLRAVADVTHFAATVVCDRMHAGRPIGHQQRVVILGVHPVRQPRRTHQIAEQDGELPPLGAAVERCALLSVEGVRVERGAFGDDLGPDRRLAARPLSAARRVENCRARSSVAGHVATGPCGGLSRRERTAALPAEPEPVRVGESAVGADGLERKRRPAVRATTRRVERSVGLAVRTPHARTR